ncbi:hypothetical protein KIF59_11605 [Enterobacter cloacae subsp. cloacae]|nr:hypothetical protein [Enterobacter cloacae subsp. cloacae]
MCREPISLHRRVGLHGEPKEAWAERVSLMKPYQINAQVMKATRQPERQVYALPAGVSQRTHQSGPRIESGLRPERLEVTEEVFESLNSIVFDEAENRMHTAKPSWWRHSATNHRPARHGAPGFRRTSWASLSFPRLHILFSDCRRAVLT